MGPHRLYGSYDGGVRFSTRTGWDRQESAFAAAVRSARTAGRQLLDLTVSNPTVCGFGYDRDTLLAPLGDMHALHYAAEPLGMLSARNAVAGYYRDHGAEVSPEQVILTTSTSEGYSFLFRLLCDAGDEVLIARPSYPLFDFLADLDDVRLRSYPLFYDHGWWIDFTEFERRVGPRTRAIVVVHPNNPTGHATGSLERTRIEALCARHGLALIVDEVFLDYPLEKDARLRSFAEEPSPVLTFVLSGLSKIAGLPQMKAGWVAVLGPETERLEAIERLEIISDTFLSMNAPVQLAMPSWIAGRHGIQRQIAERMWENMATLRRSGVDVLKADAGWSAVLRLPQRPEAIGVAEQMLARGVMVQDGEIYGFEEAGRAVLSLLTPAEVFAAGVERIAEFAR